jgi:peptide/nickel transport system substrate-binding protein
VAALGEARVRRGLARDRNGNERGGGMIGRNTRVTVALLAALLLTAGVVAGLCSAFADSSSPSAASDNVSLHIGVMSDADTLNPMTTYESLSYEALSLNYDRLFDYDLNDQCRPQLAAELPSVANGGISADGLTWTVKIRPGVKWQDGEPVTAEDVAWTYNYYVDNQLANMATGTQGIKHTTALDDTTVKIECSRAKADLPFNWLPILPKHVWKGVSPEAASASFQNKPPIVGSGPFQIVEWQKESFLRLERNPVYWGDEPTVDEIIFSVYQNADSMAADLESGVIDAAQGLLPAQLKSLRSTSEIEALDYVYRNWDYLCFNCYDGPSGGHAALRDPAFRHALNYAVDRQKLADIAYAGLADPATSLMPPNNWFDPDYHWQPDEVYSFDLAKAGQLLDEAGYAADADGKRLYKGKPIKLRLLTVSDSKQEQGTGKLITGWFGDLGIEVDYSVVDTGTLLDHMYAYPGGVYTPDYDMFIWYWDGFSDPGITLSSFASDSIENNNEPAWSHAGFDKVVNEQAQTLDPEKRKELIWQCQKIIYDQTPEMALVYPHYLQAYNTDKWTGWTRVMNGEGPAIWAVDNQDTYTNLKPKTASESDGGGRTGLVVGIVLIVAVAAAVVVVVTTRRRGRAVEEA